MQHWLSETWRWIESLDFGDVPTWLAFTGAAWVVWIELRRDRRDKAREVARQAELDKERRQSQAALVAVWYSRTSEDTPLAMMPFVIPGWAAFVRNASDLPIYDVTACFLPRWYRLDQAPGQDDKMGAVRLSLPVVPPRETVDFPLPGVIEYEGDDPSGYAVAVSFRDAAGMEWERDVEGYLRPVDH